MPWFKQASFVLASSVLLSVAAPGLAPAQEYDDGQYQYQYRDPPPPYDDGWADYDGRERGCVKECSRDMNPCDPPAFKQADGRCNYED